MLLVVPGEIHIVHVHEAIDDVAIARLVMPAFTGSFEQDQLRIADLVGTVDATGRRDCKRERIGAKPATRSPAQSSSASSANCATVPSRTSGTAPPAST
jgi:hypothetical protein